MIKKHVFFLFVLFGITYGQLTSVNDLGVNQVSNFRATSNGSTITLHWEWDSNIEITGVRVYRSLTGQEPWVRPSGGKTSTPSARSFTDIGGPDGFTLQANTDYYYAIEPYLGNQRALLSTFIKIRLGDLNNSFPDDQEGPTNVVAIQNGGDVIITWNWPSSGPTIQGFKFERRKNNGDWEGDSWTTARKISNPNARSFTDANVETGVYVYRLFAFNGSKNYTFSQNVVIGVSNGVVINQLTVSPTNRSISNISGSTTFDVSSNVNWSASDNAGWLSVTPGSGSNNGTITANYEANGTSSQRVGTIVVSGGGITRNVNVTQAPQSILEVTPENQNVSSDADSTVFGVNSNISWNVTSDSDWLTITPSSGSNNDTLVIYFEANDLDSLRIGTIEVAGGELLRSVTVTQAAANKLEVTPENQIVGNDADSTVFGVNSNISWNVTSNSDWLTIIPSSGSNNDTLVVYFGANDVDSLRIGTIEIAGGELTKTVTVTQAAARKLEVTPPNQIVGNDADSTVFEIISNISWTVSYDTDWLTVTPMTGSNNSILVVYFDANDSDSLRESTITITGEDISRTVTVSQDGLVGINELEDLNEIPKDYTLFNNYPNPFNPSTIIEFSIPEESNSMLKVYDILGKEIAVFLNKEVVPAGRYRYEFRALNIPSGVYLYVLSAESTVSKRSFKSINKMILLK